MLTHSYHSIGWRQSTNDGPSGRIMVVWGAKAYLAWSIMDGTLVLGGDLELGGEPEPDDINLN